MPNPNIRIQSQTATLCCGKKNCPTLRLEDDEIILIDDYGGHVRIKQEQAFLIGDAIEALRAAEGE